MIRSYILLISIVLFSFACSKEKKSRVLENAKEQKPLIEEENKEATAQPKNKPLELYKTTKTTLDSNEFSISGVVQTGNPTTIKLMAPAFNSASQKTEFRQIGSVTTEPSGAFTFQGEANDTKFVRIATDNLQPVNVFLEKGKDIEMMIKGDEVTFTNSSTNQGFQDYLKIVNSYKGMPNAAIGPIKAFVLKSDNPMLMDLAITDLFRIAQSTKMDIEGQEYPFFEKVAEKMEREFPESEYSKNFLETFAQIKENVPAAVGRVAPDIILNNPEGKTIKLSDLKGKVVLIDFWASWCKPCRAENPNVVKNYKQYKDDGFTVMSVSLDRTKDPWVKAIEQDGLIWPNHVWDDKQEASQKYRVYGIPHTVLVDRNGIIIAKNLRGPQLEAKLKEALGK